MKKEENLLSLFRGMFLLEGERFRLSSHSSIESLDLIGKDGNLKIALRVPSQKELLAYLMDISERDPRNVCRDEIEISKDGKVVRMIVWSAYKDVYGPGP